MTLTSIPAAPATQDRRPLLPNLGGLRAVSVLLVVGFHGQIFNLVGGFVGVSMFFTISGYLLTYRLLASQPLDSRSILRYWGGRWRRILPAAWTVLIAIAILEWFNGTTPAQATRRLLSTAAGLGNWLQLWKGEGYAALFEGGDSMVHYWSLGVEEQAYLALPLVLAVVAPWRHRLYRLATVSALAMISFALPFVVSMSVARTYYGTDTRAGEILVGVALAVAHRDGVLSRRSGRRAGGAMVLAGMAGIFVVALTVRPDDDLIRNGLLPLVAGFSVLVVHAAVSTPGVLGGVLETRPMRFLGDVSYPVYLLHWPIMVLLRQHDASTTVVAAGGLLGAVLLSIPLVRFIERPLRRQANGKVWLTWTAATAALLGMLAVSIQPTAATQFIADLERVENSNRGAPVGSPPPPLAAPVTTESASDTPVGGSTPSTSDPLPPSLPTVAVFGDSAALTLAVLVHQFVPSTELNYVGDSTLSGCGLVFALQPSDCRAVPEYWREFLSARPVDVVLLLSCQWELIERDLPDFGVQIPGDSEMDATIADAYRSALDLLLFSGTDKVAWSLCPELSRANAPVASPEMNRSRDPARVTALNKLIRKVAAEYTDRVVLVDLYTFMQPYTDDAELRPDGAHFAYDRPNVLSESLPSILAEALDS